MLKVYASISLGLVLGQITSHAQGYAPAAAPARPVPAAAGMSAPVGGMFESNTFLEMASRAFDPSSDSMDFENGSFAWKGRTFNLTSQRAFRARFERFLLASPTEEEESYALLMNDVLQRLSVASDRSDDAIIETWEMLFRAARFDPDGGNSTIVANQVFNAWRIRKEMRGTALTQRELADIRLRLALRKRDRCGRLRQRGATLAGWPELIQQKGDGAHSSHGCLSQSGEL